MGISETEFKAGPYYEVTGFGEYDVKVVFGKYNDKAKAEEHFTTSAGIEVTNPTSQVCLYEVSKTLIKSAFNGKDAKAVEIVSVPGHVKAGEYITFGWNYYEERAYILKALVDFNGNQDLEELHQRVLDDDPDTDLEVFYEKTIERWVVLGYVEQIKITHRHIGATIGSMSVEYVEPNKGWSLDDQSAFGKV